MERHLRHKFAIEVFIGKDGFPPSVEFLPNKDMVEAWEICYCMKGKDLDYFYLEHLKKRSKLWKGVECKPFHIPKKKHLLEGVVGEVGCKETLR